MRSSELSTDELLALESAGWGPAGMVCGAATYSIPDGFWSWGKGEITPASLAHGRAVRHAIDEIGKDCRAVGGRGVVGTVVDVSIEPNLINAVLSGTAIRRYGSAHPGRPFVSSLSGQSFVRLMASGWVPVGMVHGSAFVHAPRRVASLLGQLPANVELRGFTEALALARGAAIQRMQADAWAHSAGGVVAVSISAGPMPFASHAIRFTAWGTAIVAAPSAGERVDAGVMVSLKDEHTAFDATRLR